MTIPEIDELVSWVKSNVLDMPATSEGVAFDNLYVGSNAEPEFTADQTKPKPTWAEMAGPTEYDFPLSLLENILGLDRV